MWRWWEPARRQRPHLVEEVGAGGQAEGVVLPVQDNEGEGDGVKATSYGTKPAGLAISK